MPAQKLYGLIGGYAIYPGLEHRGIAQLLNVAEYLDARFLKSILCIVMPHHDTTYVPIQGLAVFAGKEPEATLLATFRMEHPHYIFVVYQNFQMTVVFVSL